MEKKEKKKRLSRNEKTLNDLKTKYEIKEQPKKKSKVKKVNVKKQETIDKKVKNVIRDINHKEIIFANEYIRTQNITQSYLAVSPNATPDSANKIGSRWLQRVWVKNYIQERLKPIEEETEKKSIASADELLEFITAVIRGEVKDQLGFETSVKDRLTATKMLAERYKLFEKQKTEEEEKQEEEKNKSKVIIEVVDNSGLEKTLYENR